MENQKEQGLVYDRLTGLEKRISSVDRKVEDLEDKVDRNDDKHDERHLKLSIELTELKGSSKATQENTERMANSIEGLVSELKQSNSRTDDRFNEVNAEVREVKSKVNSQEDEKTFKLEEKKLSNKVIIAIIGGGFIVLQVFIQVVAPLLFG